MTLSQSRFKYRFYSIINFILFLKYLRIASYVFCLFIYFFLCVCVFVILNLKFFFPCHMSEMVLLTRDRISLSGFLCLSGLFCQRPVVYPTTFSADTAASTYDSDYAFFFLFYFLSFISFLFSLIFGFS